VLLVGHGSAITTGKRGSDSSTCSEETRKKVGGREGGGLCRVGWRRRGGCGDFFKRHLQGGVKRGKKV